MVLDYRPDRAMQLMRGIKAELDKANGGPLAFEKLGRYTGESASTAFDRLHRKSQPQVEALLSLLERIQEPARYRLLTQIFRSLPSLADPRLAHDQTQVSYLRDIIRQTSGFTVIQGGNSGLRTLALSAFGHEARFPVQGLDVHQPDWFVPVEGVHYFNNERHPEALRELCRKAWPTITKRRRPTKARMFLFNGVWLPCTELHERIIKLAAVAHCIIADELQFRPETLPAGTPHPVHILTVYPERNDRLRVQIQAL
jgi:hypothetical protein